MSHSARTSAARSITEKRRHLTPVRFAGKPFVGCVAELVGEGGEVSRCTCLGNGSQLRGAAASGK